MFLANNSAVSIFDIGDANNNRLQCITDRVPCCSAMATRAGEWYFPDGRGMVLGPTQSPTTFFRDRGDDGTVNLNRPNFVMMPTGQYCCEVFDATGVNQTTCAIICECVW